MLIKPQRWNVSPALADPVALRLWRGVAFVAPLFQGAHLGGNILLGPGGVPLRGAPLTADTGTEMRVTPYGIGVGSAAGSNLLYRDNYEPIVTSDGAGTGDFTMMILCNPFAENRISWGLAQGNDANQTNHWLGFNNAAGSTATASSGTFTFSTRLVNAQTSSSVASVIDGKYHLYAGRRQGTNVDTIVDGIVRGTTSGTIRDTTTGALGISIGHRPESTASFRLDSAVSVVIAMAWNRALSDAELWLLARDPFIMLRPYPEWARMWAPAGSGVSAALTGSALTAAQGALGRSHANLLTGVSASLAAGALAKTHVNPLTGVPMSAYTGNVSLPGASASASFPVRRRRRR